MKRIPSVAFNAEGTACLICTSNGSNVITIPCNHLAMCDTCFNEMKKKYKSKSIAHFNCPVCRAPMEEGNYILVGYKEGTALSRSEISMLPVNEE